LRGANRRHMRIDDSLSKMLDVRRCGESSPIDNDLILRPNADVAEVISMSFGSCKRPFVSGLERGLVLP
jgi:hypothetical protein